MAFRRKSFRRSPRYFKRRRPVARVRRTWVTSIVPTICNPLEVPLGPCTEGFGPGQGRIILLDNSVLESTFSDRAVVKRIVGDLWFAPAYDLGTNADCDEQFGALTTFFVQAFVGLRKLQTNANGDVLKVDPLASDTDYSESEWLRTWQHMWQPQYRANLDPQHTVNSCAATICPDVHTAGLLDNDFVDGTGTINIETDCGDPQLIECTATQATRCSFQTDVPKFWHLHLDIRKSIMLREFEELGLDMDFLYADAATVTDPRMEITGGIKVLLQY